MGLADIVQIVLLGLIFWGVIRLENAGDKRAAAPAPHPKYPVFVIMSLKSSADDGPEWSLGREIDLPIPPVAGLWIGDSHQIMVDRVEVDSVDRPGTIAVFASKTIRPDDASSAIAMALDYGWEKHHWSDEFPDDVDATA